MASEIKQVTTGGKRVNGAKGKGGYGWSDRLVLMVFSLSLASAHMGPPNYLILVTARATALHFPGLPYGIDG